MSDLFPEPLSYDRTIIIEWPAKQREGHVFACALVTITDADSGERISTVSKMDLHFDARGALWADAVAFTDDAGNLLAGSERKIHQYQDDGGTPLQGAFRFLVAEMRVREP